MPSATYHASHTSVEPSQVFSGQVYVPSMKLSTSSDREIAEEDSLELLEWLHMVTQHSPRIGIHDHIDPYLCRYGATSGNPTKLGDIVQIRWRGFMPGTWARYLLMVVL